MLQKKPLILKDISNIILHIKQTSIIYLQQPIIFIYQKKASLT